MNVSSSDSSQTGRAEQVRTERRRAERDDQARRDSETRVEDRSEQTSQNVAGGVDVSA